MACAPVNRRRPLTVSGVAIPDTTDTQLYTE